MQQQQLEHFKKYFDDYVSTFYGGDEFVNQNIKLKVDHTRRVCREILLIAASIGLSDEQKLLAETVAIFHDIGRFGQFQKYGTYSDAESINHSGLGLRLIREKKLLADLSSREIKIIERSIALHGKKDMPDSLDDKTAIFSKLIRDADKLDIYCVMLTHIDNFRKNPQQYLASMGFPNTRRCSAEIFDAVMNNRTVHYKDLKTLDDMLIVQMGWITDINFVETLRQIKKRGYIEQMAALLPHTPEMKKLTAHILRYLDEKIVKA
ncbi:MAG: HD domain-containing protein [Anaerohalosphaeraceae bacterium]|nr:HD domain-containing protein [Anaerohalosphaeraceae bacterium]